MIRLSPDGKPMRALRALSGTNAMQPMTEFTVYLRARHSDEDTSRWHAPLATLVAHGLAARTGRPGGSEWYITEAGLQALIEPS